MIILEVQLIRECIDKDGVITDFKFVPDAKPQLAQSCVHVSLGQRFAPSPEKGRFLGRRMGQYCTR